MRNSEALELSVKRGSFHADKGCSPADISAEAEDLRRQVLAFEDFPRVPQRKSDDPLRAYGAGGAGGGHLCGKHLGADHLLGITGRQDQQPLHVVAQLTNVARPGVRLQRSHGVLAQLALGKTGCCADLISEVHHQFGNVLPPLGEPRHPKRHHVQPVVQVLTEPASRDLLPEVARRR